MVRLSPRASGDSGAIAILVACFAVVMFALAAIVVDLGVARDMRREAQVIADTAALAAVGALDESGGSRSASFAEATRYVNRNWDDGSPPDWASCEDPGGGWQRWAGNPTWCVTFRTQDGEDQVLVTVPRRDAPSFFGGVVGYSGMTVSADAQAQMTEQLTKRYRCAICVVDNSTDVNAGVDDGNVTVAGGDVRINGDLWMDTGRVTVSGGRVRLSGSVTPSFRSSQIVPSPSENERTAFGDPFDDASFPMPSSSGPRKNNPCADGPGVYESPQNFSNSVCVLPPGLYVIKDEWRVRNDAMLTGSGVTLYFLDDGDFGVSGDATVTLTAGPSRNAIIFDRSNSGNIRVDDRARLQVTGTVYAPASDFILAEDANATMNSLLVVSDLLVNDGDLTLSYVAGQNHPFPDPMERLPGLWE